MAGGLWLTSEVHAQEHLPEYTLEEVAQHNSSDTRIWVTYRGFVYDITDFVEEHPGGADKIKLAAGGSIEPFWNLYQQHNTGMVRATLKKYKIGRLSAEDVAKASLAAKNADDPYANDPSRLPGLQVQTAKPFNAEVPVAVLADSYITPNELWYVRHHHPVPDVSPKEYRLEVTGKGLPTVYLSLEDLKAKYEAHTVTATLQCAGNRRAHLSSVKDTQGLPWSVGAISTATFKGPRLRDVLADLGLDPESCNLEHVHFTAIDAPYDASIPIRKALDKHGDVILAYEMNGVELPRDHGYPIRAIVPGHLGARNVKWVNKVTVSDEEAYSNWQRGVPYKGFSPNVTSFEKVDPSKVPSIQELPVQSAICSPAPATTFSLDEDLSLKGYAWSGGGRGIVRVDVSVDGGKEWHTANLKDGADQPIDRAWAWTLWELDLPMPSNAKSGDEIEVICKATDASYNVQPEKPDSVWNLRGVLNNSWHRVPIKIDDE